MLEFQILFDFQRYAEGYALEPDRPEQRLCAWEIIIPKR